MFPNLRQLTPLQFHFAMRTVDSAGFVTAPAPMLLIVRRESFRQVLVKGKATVGGQRYAVAILSRANRVLRVGVNTFDDSNTQIRDLQ